MAVVRTGSVHTSQTSARDASFSVTVPTDADIIIFGVTLEEDTITGLNFDNGSTVDFSTGASELQGGYGAELYYMTSTDTDWPGTGSKTLYRKVSSTPGYGISCACWFYKNVDTTTPIRTSGTDYAGANPGSPFSTAVSSPGSVLSGDMAVGCFYNWDYDAAVNGNSQTSLYDSGLYRQNWCGCCEKVNEDTLESNSTYIDYPRGAVIVLAESSGGADTSLILPRRNVGPLMQL